MMKIVNCVREVSDANPRLRGKIASGLLGLAHGVCTSAGMSVETQVAFLQAMEGRS